MEIMNPASIPTVNRGRAATEYERLPIMAIQKVGVVGCGLMGSGIAQISAQAGFPTVVREVSQEALDKGVGLKVRYARHYLQVLRLCDAEGLTLKESFLKLGPMNATLRHRATRLPVTFFDLETA